jgi:hypothetical protein
VCNGLYSRWRDRAWENDVETEREECDRQREETGKAKRILGKTREQQ